MKAIIFGINGQDGFYLNEVCKKNGIRVLGVSRSEGNWVHGNISDRAFVADLIRNEQPDFVFHLAANSTTRHAALFENHDTISTGSINILEAVKNFAPSCKVFLTGSGVQFENRSLPISEKDPFEASSAYAVARIHAVYAARYYRKLGIKAYVGYLFHHESPMRKDGHLSKYIADGVKRIKMGVEEKLVIGDRSVRKEWGFAGDIAAGIFTLVNQDKVFEATIGTGKDYSVEAWLDACFSYVGLKWQDHVTSPEKSFAPEYKLLVSNPVTMHSLGWTATTDFRSLVSIMMES